MFDTLDIILFAALAITGIILFVFRVAVKKADALTKFQTYSKSVDASIMDSGIFTKHGIVFDVKTKAVSAQHDRSELFYDYI